MSLTAHRAFRQGSIDLRAALDDLGALRGSGPPNAVGARNGGQRLQPSSDPARRTQNIRAGQVLAIRLSPTMTDSRNRPGIP